jgi:SRSO17 transposase
LTELAQQVGRQLGEADGVLVFDPSAFRKCGNASVGVQRQWCGRLGKVENCQVGIYLGYVSRQDHALVDVRLYLPDSWAKDKKRRKQAGVPKEIRFRTRHELALEMLEEQGASLPHAWVTGDDLSGFVLSEMASLLMDEPRLSADYLAALLGARGKKPPKVAEW